MIVISQDKNIEIFALNEPDSESELHSNDILHIHSCGIMPEIMPENTSFSRPHGSEDYMINFIFSGKFLYNSTDNFDEHTTVEGGTIVIYKPFESMIYTRLSSAASNYWIHFLGSGADEVLSGCNLDKKRFYKIKNRKKIQQLFLSILTELQSSEPYKDTICNSYLLELLYEIATQNTKNNFTYEKDLNNRLLPAIEHMNMYYFTEITVDELAKLCNLSKYYFIKLFKAHTNRSPYSYLTQLRIDNAKELLEKTDLKIKDIAETIGYNDPLYFSKFFKANTNMTPIQYRKKVVNSNNIPTK